MGKIIDMFVNIKKKLMEDNLKKVIEMCQKIAFDHHGGSILTFKPIDEDRYLYRGCLFGCGYDVFGFRHGRFTLRWLRTALQSKKCQ